MESVSPPGWEKQVERMKEDPSIDNPFALAWYLHHEGQEAARWDPEDGECRAAVQRYREACQAGRLPDTVPLAAQGVLWAQAVLLGPRTGRPFHVYREGA
jgi:hypothetical protein